MRRSNTNISITFGVLYFLLLLSGCNLNKVDSTDNLTENLVNQSTEVNSVQLKQDNVERKIEDKIADITQYLLRIDSTAGTTGVELTDDLKIIKKKLLNMEIALTVDSLKMDLNTQQKLQMVDDELMQIGKEIDEMDYKAGKL